MKIKLWIETTQDGLYRAYAMGPPLTADGRTPEEATRNLRKIVEAKLRAGAKITSIRVGTDVKRVLEMAGSLDPNDPIVQEWIEIMAEQRRKEDSIQETS